MTFSSILRITQLTSILKWLWPHKGDFMNLSFYGLTLMINIFGLAVLIKAYGI